jgi:pimeloyl-ACP methyl ester carboxylesterase
VPPTREFLDVTARGDALLCAFPPRRALPDDFVSDKCLIFIHGFTANSTYLRSLVEDFSNRGYRCLTFDYNSYSGIARAGESLYQMLQVLFSSGRPLSPAAIIAHSMGGLVARSFASRFEAEKFVRTIVTLGTPHCGTLKDPNWLNYAWRWAQSLGPAMPAFITSQSARELICQDGSNGQPGLIENLNKQPCRVPILSISGGKPELTFGENFAKNWLLNRKLQSLLDKPNDGLVPESSSDIQQILGASNQHQHLKNYADYSALNHTFLIESQHVSLRIQSWLQQGSVFAAGLAGQGPLSSGQTLH